MGSVLNPVNTALIATALVPIARAMHVSVGRASVLVACLYLASAVAQPTMGKLAEEFGPRRVFLAGIGLVVAGGIVGGLAPNLTTLVVARVLFGVGTSAGYPSAMLLIRRRATAVGLSAPPGGVLGGLAVAGQATVALGLPIGGVLVGAFGWRATFLINIPVALAALAMALAWIPLDPPREGSTSVREALNRIDLGGIVGFGATITALLVFLLGLPHARWVALGLAAGLAAGLLWWELRVEHAFFDVRLLASNLPLTRTYIRTGLGFVSIYTVLYGIAQWAEAGRGLSAEQAGLLLLPMSVLGVLISGVVSRRSLVRGPLILGALAALVGSTTVLLLGSQTSAYLIVAVTLLFALTVGTTTVGNQTALYAQAPAEQVGTAAGLLRTFTYVGSIASSTITSIVFHTDVTDHGLHVIAVVLIAVSAVLLLMTVADRRLNTPVSSRRRRTTTGDPAAAAP